MLLPLLQNNLLEVAGASAAITGTVATANENDIVSGGRTTVITLTNDTWVASGATFDAQRQNILDGVTSAQAEATGWNNEVRDKEAVTSVVRTSDTVVTITWSAAPAYKITANETITVTVPATALTGGVELVASPTFTIEDTGKVIKGRFRRKCFYAVTIDGQDFVVSNAAQVTRILREVRELAEERVESDEPIKPVTISVKTRKGTESRASGILSEVRKTRQFVDKAIKRQRQFQARAAVDREIGQLLVEKIRQEEDEAKIILLM